jgi:hypothetical protein
MLASNMQAQVLCATRLEAQDPAPIMQRAMWLKPSSSTPRHELHNERFVGADKHAPLNTEEV